MDNRERVMRLVAERLTELAGMAQRCGKTATAAELARLARILLLYAPDLDERERRIVDIYTIREKGAPC